MNSQSPQKKSLFKKDLRHDLAEHGDIFFQQIISEVEDYAILLIDREGTIITWNKGAEKIKGYTAQEIIGKHYSIFYPLEDRLSKLPEILLHEAITKGKATHEGLRVRKDGTKFWGSIVMTAIHDVSGEITGFLKVTRDLTERKAAEESRVQAIEDLERKNEELKKSEARYHSMIAEVEDYAIILLDENGIILDWNKGAQTLKGYIPSEIIGKSFRLFYTEEDSKRDLPGQLLAEAASKGRAVHEGWRIRKNRTLFWGSIVISALHDDHGKLIGFTKVTRDLTERKKNEDALRSKAEELARKNKIVERLNEELSSFTYVASHDLKEPLRKIRTFSSRIEDEETNLSHNGKVYLEKIKASAERMQNLIEDLLAFSQLANEPYKVSNLDMNTVLRNVQSDLEVLINEKQAVIKIQPLPEISGVGFQVHQLFQNLLTNSLKYSKPNEPPFIEIQCRPATQSEISERKLFENYKYYHFTVLDNGIGFAPEYSRKIFDAFQRLHPVNSFSGTGIGLSIVKRVIDNHRGAIFAEGKPNVGAAFHVFLPNNPTEIMI
jgi:PAS domain S-box-containing protein